MGRGRDFRGGGIGRGRHAHEDDQSSSFGAPDHYPPADLVAPKTFSGQGAAVEAIVKWFNPVKGFGFVDIADGSGDAFLPIKAVQAVGRDTISPGAKLNVFIGQGEKGRHITRIVAIDGSGITSVSSRDAISVVRKR
jgi:cold shock protein